MQIQDLESVLDRFFKKFRDNPFDYLYEIDIHSELLVMLREASKKHRLLIPNGTRVNFSIVRGCYNPLPKFHFDIAILQENLIGIDRADLHKRPLDKNEMFLYWKKVDIGIELKLQAINTNQIRKFEKDLQRLNDLRNIEEYPEENKINTGLGILFFHRDKDFDDVRGRFQSFDPQKLFNIVKNYINAVIVTPGDVYSFVYPGINL